MRLVLVGYAQETEHNVTIYKCNISISVDVTPFSSAIGKSFPTCDLFIPIFNGRYFAKPCENHLGNQFLVALSNNHLLTEHDIEYYHLPDDFAHPLSLRVFMNSEAGRNYGLLKQISIQVVRHTKQHQCNATIVACQVSHDPTIM